MRDVPYRIHIGERRALADISTVPLALGVCFLSSAAHMWILRS